MFYRQRRDSEESVISCGSDTEESHDKEAPANSITQVPAVSVSSLPTVPGTSADTVSSVISRHSPVPVGSAAAVPSTLSVPSTSRVEQHIDISGKIYLCSYHVSNCSTQLNL